MARIVCLYKEYSDNSTDKMTTVLYYLHIKWVKRNVKRLKITVKKTKEVESKSTIKDGGTIIFKCGDKPTCTMVVNVQIDDKNFDSNIN